MMAASRVTRIVGEESENQPGQWGPQERWCGDMEARQVWVQVPALPCVLGGGGSYQDVAKYKFFL